MVNNNHRCLPRIVRIEGQDPAVSDLPLFYFLLQETEAAKVGNCVHNVNVITSNCVFVR